MIYLYLIVSFLQMGMFSIEVGHSSITSIQKQGADLEVDMPQCR